ncbi:Protein ANTAGONIST OF LIKE HETEROCHROMATIN PROTEIN 1, partial [Gonioctena quinquepunctata]
TGSSGSIASVTREANNYGQSFVPNNSQSPSNASTTDESTHDNEVIDISLNQTIRPKFHVGKSPFRSRAPSRAESESESELATSETEAQFKKPIIPAPRPRRCSRTMAVHEAKSDTEASPSSKRKRKDSPDNEKNKMNKVKDSLIKDSLMLSSSKQLASSIVRATTVELSENNEQLCNCGQPANQDHFLVDAENMQIHIECQGSIELTERTYGNKLTTLSKYLQGQININEEIEAPFPEYNSAYMEVVNAPDHENSKNPSQKFEPKSSLSEEDKFLISKSKTLQKQRLDKKIAANEKAKKAENISTNAKSFIENISKADLKDAGPSKSNVVKEINEKVNKKNYSETEYESESSSSHKQKKKKRNIRKSLDVKVGTDQFYPSNERRRTIIEDEIKNQAKIKAVEGFKILQQAYSTIKADDDLPMLEVSEASSSAVYQHWIKKLTEQRQPELDACKKAVDNRSHIKKNQNMEETPEIKEHPENYPKLPHKEQEYKLPNKSIKRKAANRATTSDPTEISNQFQPLTNDELSNNEEESNIENEDNPQLRGRQRGSNKQTKQTNQANQSNKQRTMPAIIVDSLLALDKASCLRWKEKYGLERNIQVAALDAKRYKTAPRQQPTKYIDAPQPEKIAWQQKKGPERELPRGQGQEPAREYSNYGRQESFQGQHNAATRTLMPLNARVGRVCEVQYRVRNYAEVTVSMFNDQQFQMHFRLTKQAFNHLLDHIAPRVSNVSDKGGRSTVNPKTQVSAVIWLLANPESYRSVGDRFNMGKSTLSLCFIRIIDKLNEMAPDIIRWSAAPRMEIIKRGFNRLANIPNVLGAIDGTCVKIKAPQEFPENYINRKCFYGINM